MESVLERIRSSFEESERLESAGIELLAQLQGGPRDVFTEHVVADYISRIKSKTAYALDLIKDHNGLKKRELDRITSTDNMDDFYRTLETIKSFHRKYTQEPESYNFTASNKVQFSGEEMYGRFFDLNELFSLYLNLSNNRITYLSYINTFDQFERLFAKRTSKEYVTYLTKLFDYLASFLARSKPLQNNEAILSSMHTDFLKSFENSTRETENSNDEIECTICQKSFGNRNTYSHHLASKQHKKKEAAYTSISNGDAKSSTDNKNPSLQEEASEKNLSEKESIGMYEYKIKKIMDILQEVRKNTAINIERKQSLTQRERQAEVDAAEFEQAEIEADPVNKSARTNDDVEEEKIYNPLKLPLGWDGKPIPVWLWKLHGLGVEYPCEICGNHVYMGRKAYEKHFSEWRHNYGLKCLGIVNGPMFREVIGIEDAVKLWEKIKSDMKKENRLNENTIQMEDDQGNVMPQKTYEDLKKQGLL